MKEVILDKMGNFSAPADYKKKAEEIEKRLSEELFSKISDDDIYEKEFDKDGNLIYKAKRSIKTHKNEIMPIISPTRVQTRLESILRLYRPMNFTEAKMIDPEVYLEAYTCYCELIDYINKYIVFKTTKQNFCAFAGITVETYNELMQENNYADVIKWINDGFVGANFIDSASGLYDTKAIINEAQTKDAGLNLVKNPEAIVFKGNTFINKQEVDKQLAMFEGMAGVKQLPNKK